MIGEIQKEDLSPILDTIDGAEEILDPLDGLVEKSAEDPGAAFTPEVLERLVALKREDRAAFETLRTRLKKAGCRVTALDEAMAGETRDGGRGPKQADILIDLAGAANLFQSADGTAFADVVIYAHREIWSVRSKGFRRWLVWQFLEETDRAPSSKALQLALNEIEAKARLNGSERSQFTCVNSLNGPPYLNVEDEALCTIEIDATRWRVVEKPPECFCREASVQPLPPQEERRPPGARLWMALKAERQRIFYTLFGVLLAAVVERLIALF